jgi:hypothetical protein
MNIEITGYGTDTPAGFSGTKLYKADNASILFDPYAKNNNYTPPGPALYVPDAGSTVARSTSVFPSATPTPTSIYSVSSTIISTVNSNAVPSEILATLVTRTRSLTRSLDRTRTRSRALVATRAPIYITLPFAVTSRPGCIYTAAQISLRIERRSRKS